MVATVYTPNGIVVATASYDSFHEHLDTEDGIQISPINIEGLTHTYLFYNKYSLTFNGLNSYTIEFEILDKFEELSKRWDKTPRIVEFMPYLKKLLVDNRFQIIGIVAGYDQDVNERTTPFVYQILGENIRRINLDDEGHLNYNCVYLEREPVVGKLLQQTKIKNGDIWEHSSDVKLRCDLYSLKKSLDICRFMIRTNHYVENINSIPYDYPLKADITIITKDKIETKLMEI